MSQKSPCVSTICSRGRSTLRILVVCECRLNLDVVNKLTDWVIERNERVDFVFIAGTICEPPAADSASTEKWCACEGDMSAVVSALENIHCRVIYVPGYRDPPSTWAELADDMPPRLTPHSHNAHNKVVRLEGGLKLYGFGGDSQGAEANTMCTATLPVDDTTAAEAQMAGSSTRAEACDALLLITDGRSFRAPGADAADVPTACDIRSQLGKHFEGDRLILHVVTDERGGASFCHAADGTKELRPGHLRDGEFALLTLARSMITSQWLLKATELHCLLG